MLNKQEKTHNTKSLAQHFLFSICFKIIAVCLFNISLFSLIQYLKHLLYFV